jgi:hypothetical protein
MPFYVPHTTGGILEAGSAGDGYSCDLKWVKANPDSIDYSIAYNIYFSSIREHVFTEGVKLVSIDPSVLFTEIFDVFCPGNTYYFGVRATEYDPTIMNMSALPDAGSSKMYSEGALLSDISETSTSIPISDIEQFPPYGVVQIGYELIQYTNVDIPDNLLLGVTRGFDNTNIRFHNTDGYDGHLYQDPIVYYWKGYEERNEVVFQATNLFAYPNYPRTNADGYKTITSDLLTTPLTETDAEFGATNFLDGGTSNQSQAAVPMYDYAGWHRTDPVALLRGDCLGTYYGGEQYCADGYGGVGRQLRGLSIQDVNTQRQEMLLNSTGEPAVLVRRLWTGIRCNCYQSTFEQPDDRCPSCFNTGFVGGYEQFVNPRRSDGRIMVRFGPTEDDLVFQDAGLESTFIPDCWSLVMPALKDRDFIIRFNEDQITEEFRYEILNVTRNKLLNQSTGGQKFRAQKVRKTDPIAQWLPSYDSATMPQLLTTSIGFVSGPGGIPAHTHTCVTDENITSLSQMNQTTSESQGHSHQIRTGIVLPVLGHTHTIIL